MGRARAHGRRRAVEGVIHGKAHPLDHAFEHGDVQAAAHAGALAQQQRVQDCRIRVHAGGDVRDGTPRLDWIVLRAGDRQEAAFALDQQVIGLLVLVGTAFAVARDVADDQARMLRVQRLEGQSQTRGGAGRQVLHQHVGRFQQAVHDPGRFVALQVQRQALLGAVGPDEVRGQPAHALVVAAGEVARARTFDLDDARAHVRQLAGAERRGDGVFQADDGDAVQRAGGLHVHSVNLNSAWWASVPSCSAQSWATPGSDRRPATWKGAGEISGRKPR